MKIENEIKQTRKFKSSHEKAMVNLVYTSNWFRDRQQSFFAPFGIKQQHYNILRILKGKHPEAISPGEIKEVMLDKAPDLTRLLDNLDALGYVKRNLCEHNRRKMDITLTRSGQSLLQKINKVLEKEANEWKEKLTDKEAEKLSSLLDKLRG